MAKKITAQIKLHVPAGQATPAPPVGPALGQHGVNIGKFVKEFNDVTKGREGLIVPAVISVYEDRSFSFIIKSPPSSILLKRVCNLAKASGQAGKEKIGQVAKKSVEDIAKQKMKDLNTRDLDMAVRIVEGTARSMGIEVVEKLDPTFKPPTEEASETQEKPEAKEKPKAEDTPKDEKEK